MFRVLFYCKPARVGQFFFCDLDEGQQGFLHKRAKAHSKFTRELRHFFWQSRAQVFDHLQIIEHGCWQVHQVVHVHRIVLCVLNLHLEGHLTACARNKIRPRFISLNSKNCFRRQIVTSEDVGLHTRSELEGHFLREYLCAISAAHLLPKWLILEDLVFGNRELQLVPGTSLFQ